MKPELQEILSSFHYEEETGLLYWKENRANNKIKAGTVASRTKGKGYAIVSLNNKDYKAHHVVWFIKKGYWPKRLDHKNGIRSDNRFNNLREITSVLNAANRGMNKNNKLNTRGVHQLPSGNFRVSITFEGTKHSLGVFKTLLEASLAYESKSKELRQEYHRDVS